MATPKWYPPADRSQRFSPGTFRMKRINKILLHSTETDGWPGYGGAGGNPTLTYHPGVHRWRQHIPLTARATALMNAGSFQTNRANVVQIEIIGRAETTIPQLDDEALKDLGAFVAWMHTHYGVKIGSAVQWKPYPASYGYGNGVRLSVSEYQAYHGLLGHQHAPGNVHGDPGAIAIEKILEHARGDKPAQPAQPAGDPRPPVVLPKPKNYPKPTSGDVYMDRLRPGTTNSDSVYYWRMAMNALKFTGGSELPLNGDYTADLEHETKLFQDQRCHDKQDGWPGELQAEYGFRLAEKEMRRKGVAHLRIYRSSQTGGLVEKVW